MDLVSIIIPIYNTQDYLEVCLNSVIEQSYSNIEIILINDGSTDHSVKICEKFAQNDPRVKLYNQKNMGQAAARNLGNEIAKGEYILYVDSDDVIANNHVERLLTIAREMEADIVQCEYVKFRKNIISPKNKTELIKSYLPTKALEEFCYQRTFNASPCGKLIQRSLLENIKFPVGMGYEDLAIIYQLLGRGKKIVYTNEVLYFYRQHASSTMHAAFSKKKIDRIRIAYKLKEYMNSFYPENSVAVNSRFLLANFQLLMDIPFNKQYSDLRQEVWNNIKFSRKIVMQDRKSKKSLRLMALISFGGIWILMVLGRLYKLVFIA